MRGKNEKKPQNTRGKEALRLQPFTREAALSGVCGALGGTPRNGHEER